MKRGELAAVVFLNGRYEDDEWDRRLAHGAGLLVAADGGARRVLDLGLTPDVVVGDMDSLDPGVVDELAGQGVALVRHPVRKDFTDGELAVDEALARGAGAVFLTGALGQLDHELGHIAVLKRLALRGIPARLVAPDLLMVVLVGPRRALLRAPRDTRVSVVALTEPAVVSLDGLSYPLDHHALRTDVCLGLGNHVAAERALITVHDGIAAVLVASDPLRLDLEEQRSTELER